MFTAELKEKDQTSVELHLLTGAIFKYLMDFIYSGKELKTITHWEYLPITELEKPPTIPPPIRTSTYIQVLPAARD